MKVGIGTQYEVALKKYSTFYQFKRKLRTTKKQQLTTYYFVCIYIL